MNETVMREVAWLGDDPVEGAITGVVVNFHGLGSNELKKMAGPEEAEYAAFGGLVVHPYWAMTCRCY